MTARRQPGLFAHPAFRAAVAMLAVWCAAPSGCGGGGGGAGGDFTPPIATNPAAPTSTGAAPNLTVGDVNTIVLQAINEANARGRPSTIAVVDRVGNVLTVAQMPGAPTTLTIDTFRNIGAGLENRTAVPPNVIPTTMGAIARAITGAYLSSNGNAFTTRTANQILQEHFNPGIRNTPGGPLFGTQFSQLSCSDFTMAASTTAGAAQVGPHPPPPGLSPRPPPFPPSIKGGLGGGGRGILGK